MYKKNHPFHPGDNIKTVKVKNSDFFTKNLIPNVLVFEVDTIKNPIQVYSNKGPRTFPRGDNSENTWTKFKELLLKKHRTNFNEMCYFGF